MGIHLGSLSPSLTHANTPVVSNTPVVFSSLLSHLVILCEDAIVRRVISVAQLRELRTPRDESL